MSRLALKPPFTAVRNVALAGFAAGGVWGMFTFLKDFGRLDPFASLHAKPQDKDNSLSGLFLKDVEMKHYKGDKLVTEAKVKEVDVRRDRRYFDLKGITNGTYQSEKGPLKFAAAKGTWNQYRGLLTMDEQVRVANKDFDIQTPMATFDTKTRKVTMPKTLEGTLLKGKVTGSSLVFKTNTNDIVVKNPTWAGNAALTMQDEDPTPKKWNLQGDEVETKGDLIIYTNGEGTDGDIIVRGQKIEQNRKTDVLTVTGQVEYYSGVANMTSDRAVIYRQEKRAVLTGNVTMLMKPKSERDKGPKIELIQPFRPTLPDEVVANRPRAVRTRTQNSDLEELRDPKNIREYPMIVRAESVEYFYRKGQRRANINGSPQAKQDLPRDRWRQVWADKGFWDGETQQLTLSTAGDDPKVRMKNSTGDDLFAVSFTLSTKEDDENYKGKKIKGDIYNFDNEVNEASSSTRSTPKPTDNTAKPPVDKPAEKKEPEKKEPEKKVEEKKEPEKQVDPPKDGPAQTPPPDKK